MDYRAPQVSRLILPPSSPSESLRSLIKELLAFARWRALYVVILMLMVAGLEGAGLVLLAPLIEMLGIGGKLPTGRANSISIITGLGVKPSLTTALLVYLGLIVVHSAVSWRRDMVSSELQHGFVDHLRRRLFESIGAAKWEFLAQTNSAEFSHALTTDISRVRSAPGVTGVVSFHGKGFG